MAANYFSDRKDSLHQGWMDCLPKNRIMKPETDANEWAECYFVLTSSELQWYQQTPDWEEVGSPSSFFLFLFSFQLKLFHENREDGNE